jgi:hypothetical protein
MNRKRSARRRKPAQRPSKWERAQHGLVWLLVKATSAAQTIVGFDKAAGVLKQLFKNWLD